MSGSDEHGDGRHTYVTDTSGDEERSDESRVGDIVLLSL